MVQVEKEETLVPRATLWRLRDGDCNGQDARFYTRARPRFPRGLGLRPFTVKLRATCVR